MIKRDFIGNKIELFIYTLYGAGENIHQAPVGGHFQS